MFIFKNLNYDVSEYIHYHLSAIIIQRCFRKWSVSHTRQTGWNLLRRNLCQNIGLQKYKQLESCSQIRHEWRNEIRSWIYTVCKEPITIDLIIHEIRRGLW